MRSGYFEIDLHYAALFDTTGEGLQSLDSAIAQFERSKVCVLTFNRWFAFGAIFCYL